MYPHLTNLFKLAIFYNTTVEVLYSELYEELRAKILGSSPSPILNDKLGEIKEENVEDKR